ncbi:MAG: translocation and assembly module TamB, partial [Limisphaerales bacterium]
VALLVLVIVLTLTWGVTTQSGARTAYNLVVDYFVPQLNIEEIQGSLVNGLVLRHASFTSDEVSIELNKLTLTWRAAKLWSNTLHIDNLTLNGLHIHLLPTQDDASTSLPLATILAPLTIVLAKLDAQDILFTQNKTTTAVDQILAAARWDVDGIDIQQLDVTAPLLQAQAQGHLMLDGDYPLSLLVQHTLSLEDTVPIQGSVKLEGSLSELVVHMNLEPPYDTTVALTLRQLMQSPSIELAIDSAPANLGSLHAGWPDLDLQLRATVEGPLSALQTQGTLQVQQNDELVDGVFSVLVRDRGVDIEQLQISHASLPEPVSVRGHVDWSPALDGELTATWSNVPIQLREETVVSGTLTAVGNMGRYELTASTTIEGIFDGKRQILPLVVTGHGDPTRAELKVTLDGSQLVANTAINWEHGIYADARIQGMLAQERIDVDFKGSLVDQLVIIDRLNAQIGQNALSITGSTGVQHNIRWTINAADLGIIERLADIPISGKLTSEGTMQGTSLKPIIALQLSSDSLSYNNISVASVTLDARGSIDDPTSNIQLRLENLVIPQTLKIGTMAVDALGAGRNHSVTVDLSHDLGRGKLGFTGDWLSARSWLIEPSALSFEITPEGSSQVHAWTLGQADTIEIKGNHLIAKGLCLQQLQPTNAGSICASGELLNGKPTGMTKLSHLDLAMLTPWLPPDVRLTGYINADAQITDVDQIDIDIQLQPITLSTYKDQQWQSLVTTEIGSLRVTPAVDAINAHLDLPINGKGVSLNAQWTTSTLAPADWPLQIDADMELDNLSWVTVFTEEISNLEASLNTHLTVSGTLNNPALVGDLKLDIPRVTLNEPQLNLTDSSLVASFNNSLATYQGTIHSEGGNLAINGQAEFGDELRVQGHAIGDRLLVSNSYDARVRVTPDIQFDYETGNLQIRGSVDVPEADLRLSQAPTSALVASRDQVLLNEESASADPINTEIALKLTLGDKVMFDGLGLKAQFSGGLSIEDKTGGPTTAAGEITVVKGAYTAYGQDLQIERGQVLFAGGPIDQPGINIRAARQATPEIRVGVDVSGAINAPAIEVFSNPTMPQSEQLSYLVLGRPLASADAGESSILQQAAMALGVKGGGLITDRLRDGLGVQQLGIETEPGQSSADAALVIGKYLSPKLYVRYGYGLFKPLSTLRFEYQLSKLWQIVTESTNEATGGDIQWVYEKKVRNRQ